MEFKYEGTVYERKEGLLFNQGDTCVIDGNTWVIAVPGKDTEHKGFKIRYFSLRRIDDDEKGSKHKWIGVSEVIRLQ